MKLAVSFFALAVSIARAQTALPVTGIQALHRDGQTFLTWTDAAPAAAGANYRYDVYRAAVPIGDAASLTAATLIQSRIFNNSGQLPGQFPYTQATRQDPTRLMSIVQQGSCGAGGALDVCGTPLTPFTGLAVHTATAEAAAYYAVITTDITRALADSPVVPGQNALLAPVVEAPGERQPIKYYDSWDPVHRRDSRDTRVTGTPGLPLWVDLHASGAGAAVLTRGDHYIYWGDGAAGYQDGIPGVFTVYEDRAGRGQPSLVLRPSDTVWTADGLGQLETFWFGYAGVRLGLNDRVPLALPATEERLMWMVNWAIRQYRADPDRILGSGQSMGGWGTASWSLRHPELFAALFPGMPRWRQTALPDMTTRSTLKVTPSAPLMPDQSTTYWSRMDSVAYVRANCGAPLPFIGWGIGRHDGFATWQEQVDMVNALKECRFGFAFNWNNGGHSEGPAAAAVIQNQYQMRFARSLSYPAFTNSSLDANPGNGDLAQGDPAGCINCGFIWTVGSDMPTEWSAGISNSIAGSAVTVDVTPRNTQRFHPSSGKMIVWSTTAGQNGVATADAYGLVTARAVTLPPGETTTIRFGRVPPGVGRGPLGKK
jgi:hypothetical protein